MNSLTSNEPTFFTSYEQWFLELIEPIIQVAIAKYEIEMYNKLSKKIYRYKTSFFPRNAEGTIKKRKMERIANIAELQLSGFFNFDILNEILHELNKKYPSFIYKSTFQLEKEMTNIQKRKYGLLRWIRNSERSLYQLYQMEMIKLNNGKSIRQKRNENNLINESNTSRLKLTNNWVESVMGIKPENIQNAYKGTYEGTLDPSFIKKRFTNGLKENNFNLSLYHKKKHLKTNECSYDFETRHSEEEKTEFLQEIERKKRNNSNFSGRYDWDTTINKLGINQLSFLKTSNRGNTLENYIKNKQKKALENLINLYLMPIKENYTDVFLLYRENIMMCISFLLYDNKTNINIKKLKKKGEGSFGKTYENEKNNKIYKEENLRIMTNYEKTHINTTKIFKSYPINSYLSTQVLFSYMIQKYLYNLNNNFVPDIDNIQFFYNENKNLRNQSIAIKSITKMNNAKLTKTENNILKPFLYSMNLNEIIFDKKLKLYTKYNFVKFILKIIIKMCDILNYYQEKCFFVHRDFHPYNIIVNFNLKPNNNIDIDNFQVKLIDFSLSSIIINNENHQLSQLQYTNLRPFWDCKYSNPYLNKEWQKIDLKYFFLFLFFNTIYYGLNDENYNDIFHLKIIEQLENIFINLLNIKEGFKERFNCFQSIGCFNNVKRFDMFYKKNILHNIFLINDEDENIFYPKNCKKNIEDFIKKYIKNINLNLNLNNN